jgi:hypothetical protein
MPWLFDLESEEALSFDLYVIGPLVIKPAVWNTETWELISPAVIDPKFHVTIRAEPFIVDMVPQEFIWEPETPPVVWS